MKFHSNWISLELLKMDMEMVLGYLSGNPNDYSFLGRDMLSSSMEIQWQYQMIGSGSGD